MHRKHLLALLETYRRFQSELFYTQQSEMLSFFEEFVLLEPNCFERSNALGHITGSAFIFTSDLKQVLLMHHKKIGRWMQIGGHADGEIYADEVARREAFEETGLESLELFNFGSLISEIAHPCPLDFDVHLIPEFKEVPPHLHFDVRFFFIQKNAAENFKNSDESYAMEWVPLDQAEEYTNEASVLRPLKKVEELQARLNDLPQNNRHLHSAAQSSLH